MVVSITYLRTNTKKNYVVTYIEPVLSGLPWWATIMASTAAFRLILTLPAHVTQQKVMAKR